MHMYTQSLPALAHSVLKYDMIKNTNFIVRDNYNGWAPIIFLFVSHISDQIIMGI